MNLGENTNVIESILMTAVEPRRGLSKETVKKALEIDSSSDFFGLFRSSNNEESTLSTATTTLLVGAAVAITTAAAYFLKFRR